MAAPTVTAPEAPPDAAADPSPPRRPRRRWPHRLLIGLNVVVVLALLATSSVLAYVKYQFDNIHRVTVASLVKPSAKPVSPGAPAPDAPGEPTTILVVGSDSRAFVSTAAQAKAFGTATQTAGQRSDTIMLVRLDPRSKTASLMSVPRDLWVPIADKGYSQRINTAFDSGPDELVRTIQANLGIAINHYVELDFQSFASVVNALGGVKFWYPEPVRDSFSGLNITTPGCYTLNGDTALALVRARHMQYFDNGYWQFEAESDLARVRRQQLFVKRLVKKAQSLGYGNLATWNGVIGGIVNNITVDSGFSQKEMLRIWHTYGNFNPDNLQTMTLPTQATVLHLADGDADVLLPVPGLDSQIIDRFMGVERATTSTTAGPDATAGPTTTLAPVDPSTVSVRVLNGSGRSLEATTVTRALRSAGFVSGIPGDADSSAYPSSVVRYPIGSDTAAQYLASRIVGGATLQPDPTLTGSQLVLVTGASYGGLQPAGGVAAADATGTVGPTSTPPTTAAPIQYAQLAPPFPGSHAFDQPPAGSGC